jgi:hypothetical protein
MTFGRCNRTISGLFFEGEFVEHLRKKHLASYPAALEGAATNGETGHSMTYMYFPAVFSPDGTKVAVTYIKTGATTPSTSVIDEDGKILATLQMQ